MAKKDIRLPKFYDEASKSYKEYLPATTTDAVVDPTLMKAQTEINSEQKEKLSKLEGMFIIDSSNEAELNISDYKGNVICQFKNGGVKTKDFDSNIKGTIKVLCLGNSYTQNCMGYVPMIWKSICPQVNLTLGLTYISGCQLDQHLANARNEVVNGNLPIPYEKYYKSIGGNEWTSEDNKLFEDAIADEKWDIIFLQQGSSASWANYDTTFRPYAEPLIREIFNHISHNVKLGLIMTHSSRTDNPDLLLSRYNDLAENYMTMYNELPIDIIIPYGTAIQSARTNSSVVNVYGSNSMQADSSGHLHAGLPCLIANYCSALKIMDICGAVSSVLKDKTRPDYAWCLKNKVPSCHKVTDDFSVTEYMAYLAQTAAIMAIKNPFKIYDMSNFSI